LTRTFTGIVTDERELEIVVTCNDGFLSGTDNFFVKFYGKGNLAQTLLPTDKAPQMDVSSNSLTLRVLLEGFVAGSTDKFLTVGLENVHGTFDSTTGHFTAFGTQAELNAALKQMVYFGSAATLARVIIEDGFNDITYLSGTASSMFDTVTNLYENPLKTSDSQYVTMVEALDYLQATSVKRIRPGRNFWF